MHSQDLPGAEPPDPDPLASWLADRLGAEPVARRSVGGGCIHSAWGLVLADGRRLFAKTCQASSLPLLEAEAGGLEALAAAAGDPPELGLPAPLALGTVGSWAVLVLSWLDLEGGRDSMAQERWRRLGAALARLHRRSLGRSCVGSDRPGSAFGWPADNFIGSGAQCNGWDEDWGRFFVDRRLAPQLQRLGEEGGRLRGAAALQESAPRWLNGHGAEPCLVHGDLWSGNAALTAGGEGAIFDPAVYRGDREVDLAMARLFGGFPAAFFDGYEEIWPLPAGHRRRVDVYNLYHLLNHANLFGGTYLGQCQAVIDRLLREDAGAP